MLLAQGPQFEKHWSTGLAKGKLDAVAYSE